jgi:hypothetical protein
MYISYSLQLVLCFSDGRFAIFSLSSGMGDHGLYHSFDVWSCGQSFDVMAVWEGDGVLGAICPLVGVGLGFLVVGSAQLLDSLGTHGCFLSLSEELELLRSRQEVIGSSGVFAEERCCIFVDVDLVVDVKDAQGHRMWSIFELMAWESRRGAKCWRKVCCWAILTMSRIILEVLKVRSQRFGWNRAILLVQLLVPRAQKLELLSISILGLLSNQIKDSWLEKGFHILSEEGLWSADNRGVLDRGADMGGAPRQIDSKSLIQPRSAHCFGLSTRLLYLLLHSLGFLA